MHCNLKAAQRRATRRSRSLYQIFKLHRNNSAAYCLIALRFSTEFHYVTGDMLQMFKVRGQGHSVK